MAMIRARKGPGGRRWQWRVKLKGLSVQTGTCPTKECARDCARKAEEELRTGKARTKLTLAELIDLYETRYLPTIPDSAALYKQHLAWWREELGAYWVTGITPQIIADCKVRLAGEVTRRGRLRSPATVNRYLNTLSSVFTWSCSPEVQLADFHPMRQVQKMKEPPGRVRWLSRPVDEESSELERLLNACAESRSSFLYDLVVLLLSTGCRLNEILQLRRDDIRLNEGGFTISAERAKTEEPRFVALEGVGLEVVRRRLVNARAENPYLFAGTGGNPAWLPKHAWYAALRRAGLKNFRLHDLRHTHGSYLAMLGKTLPEIMQGLGHKSPTVSLRYVHLADDHKRQVSREVNERLGAWIGSAGPHRATLEKPARR